MDSTNKTGNKPLPDHDEYLWDGSGEPDPEIQRLEGLLGRFRHDRPAPVFPASIPNRRWIFLPDWLRLRPVLAVATVAVTIAAVTAVSLLISKSKVIPTPAGGWDVSWVAGAPQVGSSVIGEKGTGHFGVGQVLQTDGESRAHLRSEGVGEIEVEANTRLRVLDMGAGLKRIALDRGTIHAYIWSAPGKFVVDTPSAVTVDLGCAYTLTVDGAGAGLVRTSLGWVGFKSKGRESFIPAGAACATKPSVGPGAPYFEDASVKFRDALARFDFESRTDQQRDEDLSIVLRESRKRDALTLWHLLTRVDGARRVHVYDRLTELATAPAGVTREAVLQLDQHALDLWWNALGFDDIAIWRQFERSWPDASAPSRDK